MIHAVASCGRTFSFGLPRSIVGAMVVCSVAAPAGVFAMVRTSSGSKSQRFATAIFTRPPASGARALTMSAPGPAKRMGNGSEVIASTAFARVSTPVSGGGAEECPPLAGAVMRSVA